MTNIDYVNWKVELTGGDEVTLTHNMRSGNAKGELKFNQNEFVKLYNLIVALSQLHPEWLQ